MRTDMYLHVHVLVLTYGKKKKKLYTDRVYMCIYIYNNNFKKMQ